MATGTAFLLAAVQSLLVAIAVPGIRLLPGTAERAELRVQKAVHWSTRFYLAVISGLGAFRVRATGREKLLAPGILVVANHPTLLDAWALMSLMPQADCIVKDRYYDSFVLGGGARGAGYIPSRDGPSLVGECAARLRRGRSLIIFPEGTRSPLGGLSPFARGAAHIALRAGCDPVLVTLDCKPPTLYRGQAWWDVPDPVPTLHLKVGEALPIKEVVDAGMSVGCAARALTRNFREHFERELNCA